MTNKKKNIVLKPEYPFIIDNISFSQESNCCITMADEREKLIVEFHDGGGGYFYIFKTEMFAFDANSEEYKQLIEKIDGICKSNDIHTAIEYSNYCRVEEVIDKSKKKKDNKVTCLSFDTEEKE